MKFWLLIPGLLSSFGTKFQVPTPSQSEVIASLYGVISKQRILHSQNCLLRCEKSIFAKATTQHRQIKRSILLEQVCSKRCLQRNGTTIAIRPAICDKARKKQQGKIENVTIQEWLLNSLRICHLKTRDKQYFIQSIAHKLCNFPDQANHMSKCLGLN